MIARHTTARLRSPTSLLGARLAALRRRHGWSLVATAQQLAPNLDSTALARRILRLERGKRLDLGLARQLAHVFDTTLAALLADTPLERVVLRDLARLPQRHRVRILRHVRYLRSTVHTR